LCTLQVSRTLQPEITRNDGRSTRSNAVWRWSGLQHTEALAGLEKAQTVALPDVVNCVLPALATAPPAPPIAEPRLDSEAIATAAERARSGPLATTGAGHLPEKGVLTEQRKQVDTCLVGSKVDAHAASVKRLLGNWCAARPR
jgi:hypothetical protein